VVGVVAVWIDGCGEVIKEENMKKMVKPKSEDRLVEEEQLQKLIDRARKYQKQTPTTPLDFLVQTMKSSNDVEMILVVRRHQTGAISYDTNTHNIWDMHSLSSAATASIAAHIVVNTEQE
jgi:hypothetical protein